MANRQLVEHSQLRRLQLPWWFAVAVLAIALAGASWTTGEQRSSLPAILPIALVAAAAVGALALMTAIRNSLPRQQLVTQEHTLATFRANQALLLVIALAPPLLAAALTATFGHVATVIAGVLAGLVLVAYGLPRQATVHNVNAKLAQHGHDFAILRPAGDE